MCGVQELRGHKNLATTPIDTPVRSKRLWETYEKSHPHAVEQAPQGAVGDSSQDRLACEFLVRNGPLALHDPVSARMLGAYCLSRVQRLVVSRPKFFIPISLEDAGHVIW